jgi:hypothetical protein
MAWVGAAGLMAAPFFIDTTGGKALIVFSLVLLSIQMVKLKAWNMVLANTVSIAGYLWSVMT